MTKIKRSALVPYSCQQMFDLINDIAAYPRFMRGCVGSEILQQDDTMIIARLDLEKAGVRHSVTTKNTLFPPHKVELELHQGPFKSLNGEWNFESLADGACKVQFWLTFEFRSKMLALAVGKLFERVASDQVDMICERAKALYSR